MGFLAAVIVNMFLTPTVLWKLLVMDTGVSLIAGALTAALAT